MNSSTGSTSGAATSRRRSEPSWRGHPLDSDRASVINARYPNDVNIEDRGTWPALWERLVPTMGRLANAIDPLLDHDFERTLERYGLPRVGAAEGSQP